MGEVDAARVDVAALLQVARQYDAIAEIVDATVRMRLSQRIFDGSSAGQAHVVHGNAVRAALDDVGDPLRQWVRAATEIAGALRAGADRYVVSDAHAAGRMAGR